MFTPGLLDDTNERSALTVLQTDDTLTICNPSFLAFENDARSRFNLKPLHITKLNVSFTFNGSRNTLRSSNVTIDDVPKHE